MLDNLSEQAVCPSIEYIKFPDFIFPKIGNGLQQIFNLICMINTPDPICLPEPTVRSALAIIPIRAERLLSDVEKTSQTSGTIKIGMLFELLVLES